VKIVQCGTSTDEDQYPLGVRSCPDGSETPLPLCLDQRTVNRPALLVSFVPTGDIAFSSVAPRLPAQSSTFKTTIAISVATIMTDIIMTDIVTNPNTKKSGSCEKIT